MKKILILLLFALALSAPAAAQTVVINETNGDQNAGRITHQGNELLNDSKIEDPPGIRMGAPAGESLCKISGDRITGAGEPGGRKEKTLLICKVAPDGTGYWEFFGQMPGTEDDAGMVRLLTLHPIEGVIVYGPITTRPRGSEYDPPVTPPSQIPPTGGGPNAAILDANLRDFDTAYTIFVLRHDEFVGQIYAWFHAFSGGQDPGWGNVAHMMWRVLVERDRWGTLRAALQNAWPL